jgi:hypothetical protein
MSASLRLALMTAGILPALSSPAAHNDTSKQGQQDAGDTLR